MRHMSTAPTLEDTLKAAIEAIITAVANVVNGVATALSSYAGLIGTVLVLTGVAFFAWRGVERIIPWIRGLFGRLF